MLCCHNHTHFPSYYVLLFGAMQCYNYLMGVYYFTTAKLYTFFNVQHIELLLSKTYNSQQ